MDPAEELRYLVLGAQREGAKALTDLLRPIGLTPAQAEVLVVVRDAGQPLTVREIGERLVCEGGSPSRLVASVVDAGLLQRGEREGDRRAVELSLTPQGAKAVRAVVNAFGARRRNCGQGAAQARRGPSDRGGDRAPPLSAGAVAALRVATLSRRRADGAAWRGSSAGSGCRTARRAWGAAPAPARAAAADSDGRPPRQR
jgi:DNA-binding MarR family transcriptional regulator